MSLIRSQERRYKAKYELCKTETFDGSELCAHLGDGEYRFPFLIYRESVHDGSNLSMANAGFEHPCTLSVKDGKGTIRLHPLNISAKSFITRKEMNGRVRKLKYLSNDSFIRRQMTVSISRSRLMYLNSSISAVAWDRSFTAVSALKCSVRSALSICRNQQQYLL